MVLAFGQIQEFSLENETIGAYLECVELYFQANGVAERRRVAVFLSIVGGKNYTLLCNILSPEKPSDKSLENVFAALKRHFEPKRVVIAEGFWFYHREQAVGETIAECEEELWRLATHCQFEAHLSQALQDRLVCGLRNEATQKHWLSKSDLTLQQAVEIAQSMEAAKRNTQQIKWDSTVHSVRPATKKEKECYCCGRKYHLSAECRFKNAECHKCGPKEHIA